MGTRRMISLLLLIVFAMSAATGILFFPYIRGLIGISDEGFWRYLHFVSTSALFVLIIIHILINLKTFGNYLKSSRIFSIIAFSLAIIIFVGILYQGIAGPDRGLTSPIYEEDVRRIRSLPEPNLVSFPEDFEDGQADGWDLGKGWEVKLEDNDYVLACSSDEWSQAFPKAGDGWFDYTLETRVKVIQGEIQIKSRTSERPYNAGYILTLNEDGLHLGRYIVGEYTHLSSSPSFLEYNRWYQISIVMNKTNIEVYVDGEIKLDYNDSDLPLIFGGIAFCTGPDSHAFINDIIVEVY